MMWGFFNWQGGELRELQDGNSGGCRRCVADRNGWSNIHSFPSSSGYGGGVVDIIYIYI